MPFVESNGIQLYYEIHGFQRTETLIMLNGVGQWHVAWWRNVHALAQHFRVIVLDNRGVGSSDKPDGAYTLEHMAADTLGLMDALSIERAHLLGHSMGGGIALMMARQAPDRVGKMVFASTLYWGPKVAMPSARALAVMQDRSGSPLDLIERGARISCAEGFPERDPEGYQMLIDMRMNSQQPGDAYQRQAASGLPYLQQDHVIDFIPAAPVLLLVGEHDEVAPPSNSEAIKAAWGQSAIYTVMPGVGHLLNIENPAAFNEAVINFLTS